jgi:F-box/TPR repeat protein Pof3
VDTIHLPPSIDFTKWSKIDQLELRGISVQSLPFLPKTLKHLALERSDMFELSWPVGGELDFSHLIELECLSLDRCYHMSMELVRNLIKASAKAGTLRTLILLGIDSDVILSLPADFLIPSIQELHLTKWAGSEEQLLTFLRSCPAIRRLDVSDTKITGVAIKELMTRDSGPLEWLCLDGCTSVSSDAIEYARSLGTVVSCMHDSKSCKQRSMFRDRYQ